MRVFILDGIEPVEVDMDTWGRWFGAADNAIAKDDLGDWRVSTVFLGLDHRFVSDGPPLIFETMIFADRWIESWCHRTSTYEEAMTAHELAMLEVTERRLETETDVAALFARLNARV